MSTDKMRAEFEAWLTDYPAGHCKKDSFGGYSDPEIHGRWLAWQAALSARGEQAEILSCKQCGSHNYGFEESEDEASGPGWDKFFARATQVLAKKHPALLVRQLAKRLLVAEALSARGEGNADGWSLALKVREALDRQACPDTWMRIAVEAVEKHYPQSAPVAAVPEGYALVPIEPTPYLANFLREELAKQQGMHWDSLIDTIYRSLVLAAQGVKS